ncbi:MAG: GYD domain-containing protein [Planctomycetes bacterium]|nr:GYD domain-containing protein [Planctomycetota bacterium]
MTFIILTRFTPETHADPKGFRALARAVSDRIKAECPGVAWKESFATMGRFDAVDIVESDDPKQVAKAVAIISAVGHCTTETLPAIPWKEYLRVV